MSDLDKLLANFSSLMEVTTEFAREVAALDAEIDDDAHGGVNARSPTGDDYNTLMAMIGRMAGRIGGIV